MRILRTYGRSRSRPLQGRETRLVFFGLDAVTDIVRLPIVLIGTGSSAEALDQLRYSVAGHTLAWVNNRSANTIRLWHDGTAGIQLPTPISRLHSSPRGCTD